MMNVDAFVSCLLVSSMSRRSDGISCFSYCVNDTVSKGSDPLAPPMMMDADLGEVRKELAASNA